MANSDRGCGGTHERARWATSLMGTLDIEAGGAPNVHMTGLDTLFMG